VNDFFIEDDSFLTNEEQDEFLRRIFSDESELYGKLNWTPESILSIINLEKTNDKSWPWKKSPLAYINDTKSEPYFQFILRPDFELVAYVFEKFCIKHNIRYDKILRVKINILTRAHKDKEERNFPHVDASDNHLVFLYYFNDSDGDTHIYNTNIDDVVGTSGNFGDLEVLHSVSPVAGKGVVFSGKQLHSGNQPKDHNFRLLLNLCFTLKKDDK
jgi:hypothetical protein